MKTTTYALLLILLLVFSGCANMSKRTKCIAASAAAGAVIGAGSGAIIGNQGDTDNRAEGSGIGAAAGAVVGGALGLVICKEDLDSDGDGVLDSKDECPNTPIGVAVDEKGCPIDSDGDGVTDDKDRCPNTPKGVKVDEKGCPLDSDGDGVTDDKDECPDTPKGIKVDEKGCPPDSDGDGVPDYKDKCPNTPRGTEVDENGCPPVGEELLILQGINFEFDSAQLTQESEDLLDGAVSTLQKNPAVKVDIEGHTDRTGSEEYNLGLSQRRAEAVKAHLISHGISEDRLTTTGKGEMDPIASNDTREGRAKNRRIEFVVTSK